MRFPGRGTNYTHQTKPLADGRWHPLESTGLHGFQSQPKVQPTNWFESRRLWDWVLPDENGALLRLMQENLPRTVLELVELSGRAADNLSRTLRNLEGCGLVKLHHTPDNRSV